VEVPEPVTDAGFLHQHQQVDGFEESVADATGPATRRRQFGTETDELTEALDEATRRWPNQSRQLLLTCFVLDHCCRHP
jgi:hypothetical protein